MSTVEVEIDDKIVKLPSRFYHLIAKLQTVMPEFCLELKVGKINCFFESEYLEIDEESETETANPKAETPDNSEVSIEELLQVRIGIDKQVYEFEGEEFWQQFLSAKTVESKNAKKFSRFKFEDNSSGIKISRSLKGPKEKRVEVTTLEVFGHDEKEPLLRMNVSNVNALTAKDFPVRLGAPLLTALGYL